jgi:dephospho-CoA kinase
MKLALTGGVAEGKTTVASYVREAGFSVVSADEIARGVFLEDAVQDRLAEWIGAAPPISPETLRAAIFAETALRRKVNALMHPRILELMLASDAVAVEAPLLFETCIHRHFERIWVVTCGPEEQLRRLTLRLGSEAAAKQIVKAQLPTRVKCAFADRIIRTNAPMDTVRSYVLDSIGQDLQAHLA